MFLEPLKMRRFLLIKIFGWSFASNKVSSYEAHRLSAILSFKLSIFLSNCLVKTSNECFNSEVFGSF